jgi:hypothetical protein
MLKGIVGCITKYAYRDVWLYYWVCVKGCLVVLLRMLKGMFFVVLLSMLKGMFGCITEYS